MPNDVCCQLVGSLSITGFPGCITSINMSARPEIIGECGGVVLYGATIGSVNISAYAGTSFFTGCPSRAGVSVNWLRRYDCGVKKTYFISAGSGASYKVGSPPNISLHRTIGASFTSINASSGSGPTGIYTSASQTEGYGLTYTGGPLAINTSTAAGITFSSLGLAVGALYLQSFSIECTPGELVTVSYSFAFVQDNA